MKKPLVFLLATALAALSAAHAVAQSNDQDVAVSGASEVRINVSGHVHIVPDNAAQSVHLHLVDNGPSTPPMKVTSSRVGSRLSITITGPSASLLPFLGPTGYEVRITVPANLAIDLREFDGHVQVDRVSSPTQIYNAEGSVDVTSASAPLTTEADAGNITVGSSNNTLNLSTGTGNITAAITSDWHGRQIRFEASNGNIALTAPPDLRATFDLTTDNGTVTNPLHSTPRAPSVFMLAQQGNITVSTPAK
jgi:hypothetical protein